MAKLNYIGGVFKYLFGKRLVLPDGTQGQSYGKPVGNEGTGDQ